MDAPVIGACSCDSSCKFLQDCCADYDEMCEADLTPPLVLREFAARAASETFFEPCSNEKMTTCAPGCYQTARGNGVCDQACKNKDCNYDDGDCAAFAPSGWICSPSLYGDGKCHCGSQCGVVDVDCVSLNNTGAAIYGCPWEETNQRTCCTLINGMGICALSVGNTCHRANVPADWFCPTSSWLDGVCDCECGAFDPDCQGRSVNGYLVDPANITGCIGPDACCTDVAGYGTCSKYIVSADGARTCDIPPAPLNLYVESSDLKLWTYDLVSMSGGIPTRLYKVNATVHVTGASLVFFGEVVEVRATWTNDGTFEMSNSTFFTIVDATTTAVQLVFTATVPGKAVAVTVSVDPKYMTVESTKKDNVALGTMTLEPKLVQIYPLTNPGVLAIGLGPQEESYLALLPKTLPSMLLMPAISSVYFVMTNGSASMVSPTMQRICTATSAYNLDGQPAYACTFDVTQWIGNVTMAHFLTAIAVADTGLESLPVFYSLNPQEAPSMFQGVYNSTNLTGAAASVVSARSAFFDEEPSSPNHLGVSVLGDELVSDWEGDRIIAPVFNHPGHLRMPGETPVVPAVTAEHHNHTRYHSRAPGGATASQTCEEFGGAAWKVLDGNGSPNWSDGSCSHSCKGKNRWLQIDLQTSTKINWVTIVNRGDCCSDRLYDVEIRIGNSVRSIDNPICRIIDGQGPGAQTHICVGTGRYLSFTNRGNQERYLALCEVSWFSATASQSSTALSAEASRAIDGDGNGQWSGGTCTHTSGQDVPWLRLDFGMRVPITQVYFWNRADCCHDRIKNFDIRVGDSESLEANPVCYHNDLSLPKDVSKLNCAAVGRYMFFALKEVGTLTICELQPVTGRVVWKPELPKSVITTLQAAGSQPEDNEAETDGVEVSGKCYKYKKKWDMNKKKKKKGEVKTPVKTNGAWNTAFEASILFKGCLNGAFMVQISGEGSATNPTGVEALLRVTGTALGYVQASSPYIQITKLSVEVYGSLTASQSGDYDIVISSINWDAKLKVAAIVKVDLFQCNGCNAIGFKLAKTIPIAVGAGVTVRAELNYYSIVIVKLKGQARIFAGFELASDFSSFEFKRWAADAYISAQGCFRWFKCWWLDCEWVWKCYPSSPWVLSGKWGEGGTDGFNDLDIGEKPPSKSGCIIDTFLGESDSYCEEYTGGSRQGFNTVYAAAEACVISDCYCITQESSGSKQFTLRVGESTKYSATGERSFRCKDFIATRGDGVDESRMLPGGNTEFMSTHPERDLFSEFNRRLPTRKFRNIADEMDYLYIKHVMETSFADPDGTIMPRVIPQSEFMPHSDDGLAADEILSPCTAIPSYNYLLRGLTSNRAPLLTQLANGDLLFCYFVLHNLNFTMFWMDHDTVCTRRIGYGSWSAPTKIPSDATTPMSAVTPLMATASAQALGAFIHSPALFLQSPSSVAAAIITDPSDDVSISTNVTLYAREHFNLSFSLYSGGAWGPKVYIPGRGPRMGRLLFASRLGDTKEMLLGVERAYTANPFIQPMDQNTLFMTLINPDDSTFSPVIELATKSNVTEDSVSATVYATGKSQPHTAAVAYVHPGGNVHLMTSTDAATLNSWSSLRILSKNASEHVTIAFVNFASLKLVAAWAVNTSNANVNLTSTVTQYCIMTGLNGACNPVTIPWISASMDMSSPPRDMAAYSHHLTRLADGSLILSWAERFPGEAGQSFVRWALLESPATAFSNPQTTTNGRNKPVLFAVAPAQSSSTTDIFVVTAEGVDPSVVNATVASDVSLVDKTNDTLGDSYVSQLSVAPMVTVTSLAYDDQAVSVTGTVANLGSTTSGVVTVSLWGGDSATARLPLQIETVLPAPLKPGESANVTLSFAGANTTALLTGYIWMMASDAKAPSCANGKRVIAGTIRFGDLELKGGTDGHIQACGNLVLTGYVPNRIPVNLTMNRYNSTLRWDNDTQAMKEDGSVTTVLLGEAFSQADSEYQEVCVSVQKVLSNLQEYAPPMIMTLNYPPDIIPTAKVQLVSLHFSDLSVVDAGITLTALKGNVFGSLTIFNTGMVVACRPLVEIFMSGAGQNQTLLWNTTLTSVPANGQVTIPLDISDARLLPDVNITLHFVVNRRLTVAEAVTTNNAIHRTVVPMKPAILAVASGAQLTLTSLRRRDISSGTTGVLTITVTNSGEGTALLVPIYITTGVAPGSPTVLPQTIYYPSIASGDTVQVPMPFTCPGCRDLTVIPAAIIIDPMVQVQNLGRATRNTVFNVSANNANTPAPPSPPSTSIWGAAARFFTAEFWTSMTPQNIIITVFAIVTLVGVIVAIIIVCKRRRARKRAVAAKIAELEALSSNRSDMEQGWSDGGGSEDASGTSYNKSGSDGSSS